MILITHLLTEARKFLAALVGLASLIVSQGLLSGDVLRWTNIGIGVGTALTVYGLPNTPKDSA